MLGVSKALLPFMLGALALALYLPLLGAPMMLFLFLESASVVFRGKKNGALRPFSKVDEVDLYPYNLGEVAFGS